MVQQTFQSVTFQFDLSFSYCLQTDGLSMVAIEELITFSIVHPTQGRIRVSALKQIHTAININPRRINILVLEKRTAMF